MGADTMLRCFWDPFLVPRNRDFSKTSRGPQSGEGRSYSAKRPGLFQGTFCFIRSRNLSSAILVGAVLMTASANARAQSTIDKPGAHVRYLFELEPHFSVGTFDPPGSGTGTGFGGGVHGTFEILRRGFIPTLNDSVGIGFAADWLRYDSSGYGRCTNFESGPSGTRICTEVEGGPGGVTYLMIPVVMQWNFWLTRSWSVFVEPGAYLYFDGGDPGFAPLTLSLGGRFLFADSVAVTARVGHPELTIGLSIFL